MKENKGEGKEKEQGMVGKERKLKQIFTYCFCVNYKGN